ncbi:MAG: 3-deoxy-manno-octulosonate cytidylyltransferase [Alphaproteobacteria bacterium]|nr:3-deoxy-manno-octulosonate cytidylyltransferase [Alphaproteobacteria bacterium]
MNVLAVIPARWASSRFPGKPLAEISGKAMVHRVWDRVQRASSVDACVIATDDERIAEYCREHGLDVEMTRSDHNTGTDRLAEVATRREADIFVNVQGDEPLINPAGIDAVVKCLIDARERGIDVSNAYVEGASAEQLASTSVVHLVPTLDGCVLTLSRLPVPCTFVEGFAHTVHVGLYALTPAALARFSSRGRGPVERAESIEMMRFIERGERIACVAVPPGSIGVDHPEDIARVEALLATRAD